LSGNKVRYYTETLSVGAGYTTCTAPTSIDVTSSIVTKGTTITVSWDGAKAGTNNSIAGYRLYYAYGKNPTTSSSSYDIYTSETSGSKELTLNSSSGTIYYFKVQTLGTVSGYNSTISSSSASTKINTPPSKPSVTLNYYEVPSSGGTVKADSLSATEVDGQTLKYFYSTVDDITAEKTPVDTSTLIPFNANT
jgi:hypothetical protein